MCNEIFIGGETRTHDILYTRIVRYPYNIIVRLWFIWFSSYLAVSSFEIAYLRTGFTGTRLLLLYASYNKTWTSSHRRYRGDTQAHKRSPYY